MMIAVAGMLSFTACGNKTAGAADADSTAVAETENAEANKQESLADVVAKAKAEGEKWSVDEWKAAFRQVAIGIKPMAVDMDAFFKKVTSGEAKDMKAADIEKEGDSLQAKYAETNKLLDEFTNIAKGTENGTKVVEDDKWGEELFKELGIPSLK